MSWSVLTAAPQQEIKVANEIARLGYQAYCPTITRTTKPRRKSSPVQILTAAFPGYLFADPIFIQFASTPILQIASVHQLRLGETFCHVTDSVIEELRADEGNRSIHVDRPPTFHTGDLVRIASGPLVGFQGQVARTKGQRVQLAVNGFAAKIYMPAFCLQKVPATTVQ